MENYRCGRGNTLREAFSNMNCPYIDKILPYCHGKQCLVSTQKGYKTLIEGIFHNFLYRTAITQAKLVISLTLLLPSRW